MAEKKVNDLNFKAEPTKIKLDNVKWMLPATIGIRPSPSPSPLSSPYPVGGEIVGVDTLSLFLSNYWPLLLLLLIPVAFALYKKRSELPKLFMRLRCTLKELWTNLHQHPTSR